MAVNFNSAISMASIYEKVYSKEYYLFDEVINHNTVDDFWLIINSRVLNLSPLLETYKNGNKREQAVSIKQISNPIL